MEGNALKSKVIVLNKLIVSIVVISLLSSCSIARKKQGLYGAFIFEKPIYNKNEPRKLYTEEHVSLFSYGCGPNGYDFNKHYENVKKAYKEKKNNQIVGISNVRIETYIYIAGIIVLPCMEIWSNPIVVEKPDVKKLFPIDIKFKIE